MKWQVGVIGLTGAGLVAGCLFSPLADAQGRPDAGTILDTVKPAPSPPRPSPGLDLPSPPRPALSAQPGLKVQVKGFRILGNTLFSADQLQPLVDPFVGKELDMDGLNAAAAAITNFYRAQGYFLAQAYLPRQELKDGVVEIYVMEGRIGKVEVHPLPEARLRSFIAEGYLNTIKPGDPIRQSDIERPLLLLQDLPGVTARSTIAPGAKPGEADLRIDLGDDGRRITGVLEMENFGDRFAGETRISGQVFLNNPLGLGDQLTVRGLIAQDKLTDVVGFSYLLPVGYFGTKLGINATHLRYELEGGSVNNILRPAGKGDLYSVLALHPVVRSRDLNVFAQLTFEQKKLEDRTIATTEERELQSATVSVFGDSRDSLFGGGFNSYALNYVSGDHKLKSPLTIAADSILNEGGHYSKYYVEFKRVQRITDSWHGYVFLAHQGASRNLASVEKIATSGPHAVRAYPVGEAQANEATLFTAELRYTIPKWSLLGGNLTLAAFYDVADLKRYKEQPASDISLTTGLANPNRRTLEGAGVGVRWGREGSYAFVADFAWRIEDAPLTDRDRNPRVWLHGIKWF